MVTIETVSFKPRRSLILEMNFPLPVWVYAQKAKSSKNGFETHTNTEEEENLPLRAS